MTKRSGTKFICQSACGCGECELFSFNDRVVEVCPCKPPRYINPDGTIEILKEQL